MAENRLIYIVIFSLFLVLSCEDSPDNPPQEIDKKTISGSRFLDLAKKSGCLACHNEEKIIVGPSWRAVSERYVGDVDACTKLIKKVKNGGTGNWTDITKGAPMPSFSERVTAENINTLVSYILGISGENCGGEKLINLQANTSPTTIDLKQGEKSNLYFSTDYYSVNSIYNIEIIMINGIVDLSIEYVESRDNLVVIMPINGINGIDGQTSYEFIPTKRVYDLMITAKTDAIFSLTITTSENTFLSLAKVSGCLACHSILKKIVGPAWLDVSDRYRGDAAAEAMLIEKVKQGGSGNWTDVPSGPYMPPYSPRVSDANITRLVQEILKLQ